MIVRSETVVQTIDGSHRARFLKEVVQVEDTQPITMVRKRLLSNETAHPQTRGTILLTHGFGQNRHAWHISGRSLVNHLAARGFDVFNLDLRGHGRSHGPEAKSAASIDESIREDVPAAVDEALRLSGSRKLFLVGHSLGALVACGVAGERSDVIAGLVAIAPPYRFGRGSPALDFAIRCIRGLANVGIIREKSSNLPIRAIGRMLDTYRFAWDSPRMPLPIRAWHPGTIEPLLLREYLHASFDSASIGTLLQMTDLAAHGAFRSEDHRIDYGERFEELRIPLLVIAGSHDLLAPPASVRPLYDRARVTDKTYRVVPLGHADLLLGRDAPTQTWPLISQWLVAHAAPSGSIESQKPVEKLIPRAT